MIALIMAGGFGTRFWPQSRKDMPKQFLRVTGDKSMLQLTVDRLTPIIAIADIFIVTAANQVELVKLHLPDLPTENIIIEPFGMNTAPCIGLSIAYLKERYPLDTSLVVLPADHVITDIDAFHAGLAMAEAPAARENLVTFGIIPDYPATGFGYIEAGPEISPGIFSVSRFKEKPDSETARAFLSQGNFFWNSGMFFWKLGTIWNAFCTHMPEAVAVLEEISQKWKARGYCVYIDTEYARMPKTPIDIGIMEKATSRAVIPVSIGWSDVGSFKALAELSATDEDRNSLPPQSFCLDATGNYVRTTKYTALIGVSDLCVIETADAILIMPKDRAEDVKKVVDHLSATGKNDL
ncbi:MAG: sugar phosphate nucleotidyltransferase, partial [Candidatus Cloacimonadaceae bacterium]|nr:sugar phosphate nucleotidyltransferase [Candidatus Cloacimonadaceae bacterium]